MDSCKREDCIDQFLNRIKNGKLIKKKTENSLVTRCDISLIAHNAVRFDNWLVLQKLIPSFYVESDGVIDPFREKKIVKTSRGKICKKNINEFVGKIPQYVTFTCSNRHQRGKRIDIAEIIVLQDCFLNTKRIIV